MDSVRDMTGHWRSENIHFESFGAPQTSLEQNTPFDIVLQSTGKRIHVGADVSILEALRSHGESVSSSCESGTCGSCRTGFISGEVEHRDWVLLEDERSQCMMICVSRALSQELVLDR
jgi:phthalate 4,5-dioxygenase reductase subunit